MTSRKIFKGIGIFFAVIIGVILLFFAFVWGSFEWNQYSKKKEAIRYQKEVCDTIKTVEGNFPITFNGFNKKELSKIHFYLQQEKLLIRDTIVNFAPTDSRETQEVTLPFKNFGIKDKLIISLGNRYFVLSGYSYIAGYNYGMFGPVGSCECKPSGFNSLNGAEIGSGWLIKKHGLVDYQLPPR